MSLKVCQLCYMSPLHSPATCPVSVYLTRFFPRYILQHRVLATCPLVWAHLNSCFKTHGYYGYNKEEAFVHVTFLVVDFISSVHSISLLLPKLGS